jgi:hypothetical protein
VAWPNPSEPPAAAALDVLALSSKEEALVTNERKSLNLEAQSPPRGNKTLIIVVTT